MTFFFCALVRCFVDDSFGTHLHIIATYETSIEYFQA